jgi:hypothetical protein
MFAITHDPFFMEEELLIGWRIPRGACDILLHEPYWNAAHLDQVKNPGLPKPQPFGLIRMSVIPVRCLGDISYFICAGRRPAKQGHYWQKVSASNGTRYLCRSTTDAKIQKAASCTAAGAQKP